MSSLGFQNSVKVHEGKYKNRIVIGDKMVQQEEIDVSSLRKPRVSNVYWRGFTMVTSLLLSMTLLGIASRNYTVKYAFIVPSLMFIGTCIALMTWLRNMLSMNKFCKKGRSLARYSAIYFYMLAGFSFFASSLAVMQRKWTLQFVASLSGSVIAWVGFLVIFEGCYKLPSRQQVVALLQILLLAFLWELRTFIVNLYFDNTITFGQ